MELDLTPKLPNKVYDGGDYYAWCPKEIPMLREGNIGAAKLALRNNGFALPRYSDSAKVAYVLQGSGVAGIVLPEKEEKVIPIKKGDAIALPFGVVTWWYNKEDTELVVLFLGDTSKAHKSGSFTDFFLTGPNGIFTEFSTEFVGRAWDLEENVVKTLVGSQSKVGIVKLDSSCKMPEPKTEHYNGMALNCEEAPLDVDMKDGGKVVVLNTKNLPLVGEVGLGADLVRLNGNAMCSPGFSCGSALQVTYIVRGSGRVQVVGVDGKRVLETTVEAGNLFIVPRFFVVSKISNPEGMDWFSIITTPNPVFTHLAGRTSVWKALSPEVLQAAFNVPPEVEQKFSLGNLTDVEDVENGANGDPPQIFVKPEECSHFKYNGQSSLRKGNSILALPFEARLYMASLSSVTSIQQERDGSKIVLVRVKAPHWENGYPDLVPLKYLKHEWVFRTPFDKIKRKCGWTASVLLDFWMYELEEDGGWRLWISIDAAAGPDVRKERRQMVVKAEKINVTRCNVVAQPSDVLLKASSPITGASLKQTDGAVNPDEDGAEDAPNNDSDPVPGLGPIPPLTASQSDRDFYIIQQNALLIREMARVHSRLDRFERKSALPNLIPPEDEAP